MTGELAVAALAVIASTTTAVVSMIVTSRTRRIATREQTVWKERTDTYLRLQDWVQDIHDWFDSDRRVKPPKLNGNSSRRVSLFSSPFVIHHVSDMRGVIREIGEALSHADWDTFRDLRWQLSNGFAVDLTALLRDEMSGRPNEYSAGQNGEIRLSWRKMQALKWRARRYAFRQRAEAQDIRERLKRLDD
jgi:hypothetical protein